MLRSRRKLLWALRRSFSSQLEKPKPENKKKVTHFNPSKPEVSMRALLQRESPLLKLSDDKAVRGPFIKQIFQKHFDERFLTYPDVLDTNRVDDINALYERVKQYVDSLPADCMDGGPPPDVMQRLGSLGVFKMMLPIRDGGSELTMTEMARVMEAFGSQPSLAAVVATHNVAGIRTLTQFAAEPHRTKFLPRLLAGEPVAAFAIDEDMFAPITTIASVDSADQCTLNGAKVFVKNGERAELFVVVCGVRDADGAPDGEAALLVQRNLPGVVVQPSPETPGLAGSGLSTVYFSDVKVPLDCVLGGNIAPAAPAASAADRTKIAERVAASVRCALSGTAVGATRSAFDVAFRHTFYTERFKTLLCAMDLVRDELCNAALDVYKMESCLYLTLAIEDVVEQPDVLMESVATTLICKEASRNGLVKSADILGVNGKRESHNVTRWLNDVADSPFFFASPRDHSLSLARIGLRSTVHKLANPKLAKPPASRFIIDESLQRGIASLTKDSIDKDGKLYQFVHPSLAISVKVVDFFQRQFGLLCERLVQTFGEDELLHNEAVLQRVSQLTVDLFAMSCVMARSSRSYCIGLYNGYEEVKMATVFVRLTQPRFERTLEELNTMVERGTLPGTSAFSHAKRYPIVHPLQKRVTNP